jgi:hypothetical protein
MTTPAPGTIRTLGQFLFLYVILVVVMTVVIFLLVTYSSFDSAGSGLGALVPILAAMQTGTWYGKATGAMAPGRVAWGYGLLFLVASVLLSVLLTVAAGAAMGFDVRADASSLWAQLGDDGPLIAAILGGFLLFFWVILRFSFSTGVKQGVRAAGG